MPWQICITLFKKIKANAIKRKLEFDLTIDDLADLIDNDYDSIGKAMEILAEHMGGSNEKKSKAKK